MHFNEIQAAWVAGQKVQYLVLIGHDDEWTDYAGTSKPKAQPARLAWRIRPPGVLGNGSATGHTTAGLSNLSRQAHGYGVGGPDGN